MARKVFDEQNEDEDAGAEASQQRPAPRRPSLLKGGAAAPKYIQGSTQSASERTHEDIPVNQIQDSLIDDRIDVNEDLDELVDSISKNGQQIPITVRIVNKDKPYEIVAGRRRLAAIRQLGKPTIRGFITKMSDKEAFIAQGIENSARLETSFIERARTAVKAYEAGFTQEDIAEFLNISQSLINLMVKIFEATGDRLVQVIGPARGVGRRKWDALIQAARKRNMTSDDLVPLVDTDLEDSAARFEALLQSLEAGGAPRKPSKGVGARPSTTRLMNGQYALVRRPGQLHLKAGRDVSGELLDFVEERLPDLVKEFQRRKEESPE